MRSGDVSRLCEILFRTLSKRGVRLSADEKVLARLFCLVIDDLREVGNAARGLKNG